MAAVLVRIRLNKKQHVVTSFFMFHLFFGDLICNTLRATRISTNITSPSLIVRSKSRYKPATLTKIIIPYNRGEDEAKPQEQQFFHLLMSSANAANFRISNKIFIEFAVTQFGSCLIKFGFSPSPRNCKP